MSFHFFQQESHGTAGPCTQKEKLLKKFITVNTFKRLRVRKLMFIICQSSSATSKADEYLMRLDFKLSM
jgi:hypothetical protein